MSQAETVAELLKAGAGGAVAIAAPGRPPLTHGALRRHVQAVVERLNGLGIGRGDRVAIVLPNGPEMAVSFLAVAAGATTAPLNPAYREDEFEFYLSDLKARALIVMEGEAEAAVAVARRHGAAVLRLRVPEGAPAGLFELEAEGDAGPAPAARGGLAEAGDTALVLHTSGTTSRPKIVPLSQANICASAAGIAGTLRLKPDDRCLNIMPLFHIHGLMAATLSSMAAGASVCCTPGFNALRFFAWLEEARPTWYTAVPTMHQAILARAERNPQAVAAARLRFIRSSSSSLPPQVMKALEETFACPVIESYGMTEASHQMTSNPLPPAARKAGSVGIAAGPAVRVADQENAFLAAGEEGEVVISGPGVTRGYEANEEANAKSFFEAEGQRWFRTGDQGRLDEEGYLRLTGRLKEIINRGGEKVSPLEVDEVLMDHPSLRQVVTFAMPHEKLGEEVAAAVVLREGMSATEQEIRAFAATRLADFKVPRRILVLDEIPKGATGKLQRIGLAQKLGLG
ncbi:acyl--CoA ligase [Marinimicrococcus flavescens]|uniref:Acyl--CoA ligase n=1 Tax=Marinimicrococcus flavescens TaxID=3031815 RepID=A0AAP3XSN1_9PROT|nr:acyl--CoA ligase [Marinimicrococcus flavescens]